MSSDAHAGTMEIVAPWYRLGYVIPHLYTDMDAYQFYRIAPEGMMLLTTGFDLKEYGRSAVEQELPRMWERFDLLAKQRVERIALSGVPIASILGRARVRAILDEAQARTGIACDTDLEAHIAALHHLGTTKIVIGSRWPAAVNDALGAYLAAADIEVLACHSQARSLDQNKRAAAADDHALALQLGRDALRAAPDAQALLLPGGLWFAIHAAPMLEAEFDRPVLLNISSTTWAALRACRKPLPVQPETRWGRLLAGLRG